MTRVIQSICFIGLLALGGCAVLPASGPFSFTMDDGADIKITKSVQDKILTSRFRYAMVDIARPVTDYLAGLEKDYTIETGWPKSGPDRIMAVSVGDTLSVTIYESQTGGLFIPSEAGVRPGNYVSLPGQTVDKTGVITVPYAGEVNVLGRTPDDIGREITEKLGRRAIEPQVVVSVTNRSGAEVSIIGDVGNPTRYSLSLNGERILDAIARAGGPSYPGYESYVTLQRGKKKWTIPFDLLVLDPDKNIRMEQDDTVYVYREAEMFQMFGASGFNGAHSFPKRNVTLAEALGEAGGLSDAQADPAEIYLYREELRARLTALELPVTVLRDKEDSLPETMPVIYRLNLRDPEGFFLAQKFPVRNMDIIYVANAESVEFTKFLDLLGNTSGTKITTQDAAQQ